MDYTWQAASGGDFGNSANWTPTGVPSTGDGAFFNSGTGMVTSSGSSLIGQWVLGADLTFDFNGNSLIADSLNATASSATLSDGIYDATATQVGSSGGATLNVSGLTASLTVGGLFNTGIAMAANTSGSLVISNGATLTATSTVFGIGEGSGIDNATGLLHITGSGTSASFSGVIAVGSTSAGADNNVATFRISDGATVTGGLARVGQTDGAGSSGTLIVEGGASYTTSNTLQIGELNDAGTSATVIVQTGGTYDLNSGSVQIYANSTVYVGAGSTLRGGTIQNNQGDSSAGESATVMGSGTILSASDEFNQFGTLKPGDNPSAAGIGTLTIGDGSNNTDMTLNARSNSLFEFTGTNTSEYDRVLVTGAIVGISGGGDLILTFNFAPSVSDNFTIMSASDGWFGLTASDFNVTWAGLATGGTLNITGNDLIVSNVAAVPEPSTYFLFGMGSFLLWMAVRRRKKQNPASLAD